MSGFCVKCRFVSVCPAAEGLWNSVSKVVSSEGYSKLDELLYEECLLKVDKEAVVVPPEESP